MAKKNKNESNIILTQGLVLGEDTTRLINITSKDDLLYLDVTLYYPEFKYAPDAVFDSSFIDKANRHPDKALQMYDDAINAMYGDNMRDMGFKHDDLQRGLTFSFRSHREMNEEKHPLDDPRLPKFLGVKAVNANIEKQISFDAANDFTADNRDERLGHLLTFMRGHEIISPNKGRFGPTFNFQTMLAGLGNITQAACNNFVFKNKIEAVNRIRREDYDLSAFQPVYNFINTNSALSSNVSEKCRTFVDVNVHSSAMLNTAAISSFVQNRANIFTPKQTGSLAKIYHKKSLNNNSRPAYQRR